MIRRPLYGILTSLTLFMGLSFAQAQDPIRVVATYSILGDMVRNVGGDNIELTVLVGADSDSHTYEPTPQDAITLSEADIIFENGLEFESWFDELYEASGSTAVRVEVSTGIEPLEFEEHDHEHEGEAGHDHEDEHEEVTDLSPWAGGHMSGYSVGIGAMQPGFDAVLASTPELTQENLIAYWEEGNRTDFATMSVVDNTVTFTSADGTELTCAYTLSGEHEVPQVPGEEWSIFETTDEACTTYRVLLLNPPHASEEGAIPHFHMRYGSADTETVIDDMSPWFPSIYPAGTTADQILPMWVASARQLGIYVANVYSVDIAMTEEEMAMMSGEEEEHEGEGEHDHEHGEYDPHIWHSVTNAKVMVENIRDGLSNVDAANIATYEANALVYMAQLDELQVLVEEKLAELPQENRILVTSHDTFGYFAREYNFEVLTVLESVSTEASDPSAGQIAELVTEIQEEGVKAIFAENITNPDLLNTVAQEAGVVVAPTLYTDALGAEGTAGATYIEMMQYNITTIVDALK
jgi:ABC-type Zn uptake system ZnuABC Zn-binding protein ZnuA